MFRVLKNRKKKKKEKKQRKSLLHKTAVRLDMYKSQACMREDKGEKNQNEPRRQEIKKE